MSRLIINNFNEFAQHIGQELGVSDYLTITQEQIDLFADATLDHQWIHVDTERARTESPYKSTIAHGYLNLSVLANLRGIAKAEIKVSLEIKDSPKTALDATVVFLYHFQ